MNAVHELRRSSGLTQSLLAELSGVSQTTISRYETSRRTPTLAMLSRLAEAVDFRAVVLLVPLPRRHKQGTVAHTRDVEDVVTWTCPARG